MSRPAPQPAAPNTSGPCCRTPAPDHHHRQHGRLAARTRRVRRTDRLRPLPRRHQRVPAGSRPGHPAVDGARPPGRPSKPCKPAGTPRSLRICGSLPPATGGVRGWLLATGVERSPGELWFAAHTRAAPEEMRAFARGKSVRATPTQLPSTPNHRCPRPARGDAVEGCGGARRLHRLTVSVRAVR